MIDLPKKDDYSASLIELVRCSENGKSSQVKHLIERKKYQIEAIDVCIRKCIIKYVDRTKDEYLQTILVLLPYIDINYQNPSLGKSTIIMVACQKGDMTLIKKIVDKHESIDKVNKIDLSRRDNNLYNFVHYILHKNTNEEDALEILTYLLNYNSNNKNTNITNEELLTLKDDEGFSALSLILSRGWSKMLDTYFTIVNYHCSLHTNSGNTPLHFAIEGKSLQCLKKILSYTSLDDLKIKNNEGYTPSVFATKKKYYFFSKILDQFETNYNNCIYKNLLLDNEVNVNDMLDYFNKKNYTKALNMLNCYRVNQSIIGDLTNISCEWNIILTKRMLGFQKGISPEHILSKFCHNNTAIRKQSAISYNELSKFFTRYVKDINITEHKDENNYPIDIIVYNKVIFYMKIGDMNGVIRTITLYLNNIYQQNYDKYYKHIITSNFLFIIVEYFISKNENEIALSIIEGIESYLKNKSKEENNKKVLLEYLNQSELISQYSPSLKDCYCYLHLLRSMCSFENAKKHFSNYKNEAKGEIIKEINIFNRLKGLYIMLKAKMNYKFNFVLKAFQKISLIKDNYFDVSNEYKLFYYNSTGILYLKLKHFSNAEFMFKTGLEICKRMYTHSKCSGEDLIIQKANLIINLKFNLALSLFYQKKYSQSNDILKELSQKKIMNKNVYLWYRLGLTCLEIHLISIKPNNPSNIVDNSNKDNSQLSNQKKEESSSNGEDNNMNDDYDELYHQFEQEYGDYPSDSSSYRYSISSTKNKNIQNKLLLWKPSPTIITDELNDAINSFNRVISLQNGYPRQKEEIEVIKAVSSIIPISQEKEKPKNINQSLLNSSYLNLLFCFSLSGKWSSIVFLSQYLLSRNSIPNDIKGKVYLYKIEALIHLKQINEALKSINSLLGMKENYRVDLYNINRGNIVNDIHMKMFLRIGMIYANCQIKSYEESEKLLQNLLETYYKDKESEIPIYIIYLGVYINLLQGKKESALRLLKHKTFEFNKEDKYR